MLEEFERRYVWIHKPLDEAGASLRNSEREAVELALALVSFRSGTRARTRARFGFNLSRIWAAPGLYRRYRHLLREEIGATVVDPAEVNSELRHLLSTVGR